MKKWRVVCLLVKNDKNCFSAHYFRYESPSIKFCRCDFLPNFFTKGLFLTSTTQTLPTIFNGRNCKCYGFLIFGCKLVAEFQCRIDLCMMDGYIFSSIMLTFFTKTSPLKTSVPLRKHMSATMDQHYALLSFQFQFSLKLFQYIRICQRNTGFYPKHLLRWRLRRLQTLQSWNDWFAKNV